MLINPNYGLVIYLNTSNNCLTSVCVINYYINSTFTELHFHQNTSNTGYPLLGTLLHLNQPMWRDGVRQADVFE